MLPASSSFFFFVVLVINTRALHILDRHSTAELHPSPF
jgi:hypothetical protein